MNINKTQAPVWKLEFYLLGELPADELSELRALEQNDAEFRAQIAELRAVNEKILAQYPPALMAAKYQNARAKKSGLFGFPRKPAREPRRGWNWNIFSRWAVPAFVCAAALVCLPARLFPPAGISQTAPGAPDIPTAPETDGVRVKGLAPSLEVWRKSGGSAEKLTPRDVTRAGDILQLRYIVPKPCYGALVSVDGRGVITVHLAGDSGNAAALTPGRPVALDSAYRLDDAPRFETFYLITADGNFDVDAAAQSLKNAEFSVGEGGAKFLGGRLVTEFMLLKS